MRRDRLTTREVRQIREWRTEGYSLADIIVWSNRSRRSVLKYAQDIPSKHDKPPKVDKEVLFQLLSQGVSAINLAKMFGCHTSRIYQLIKRRNADVERERALEGQDGGGVATEVM